MAVPKRFTDEFIKDEIAELNGDIAKCERCSAQTDSIIASYSREIEDLKNKKDTCLKTNRFPGMPNTEIEYYDKAIWRRIRGDIPDAHTRSEEYSRQKLDFETKKRELEELLRLSPAKRVGKHYQILVDAKKEASTEEEFIEIAQKFRTMEGYKDTDKLADDCDNAAVEARYNRLVKEKNMATTEDKCNDLVREFRLMKTNKNTAKWARECENRARECENRAVDLRYKHLVQKKKNASTEYEYQKLEEQFQAMNGYENSEELAKECGSQYRVLKDRREEDEAERNRQKILEIRRKRREKIETAKLEAKYKCQENWKRLLWTIFSIVLGGIAGGLVFAFLAFLAHRYEHNFSGVSSLILALVLGIWFGMELGENHTMGCLGGGCLGIIAGIIVGGILYVLFTNTTFIVSNIVGVVIGAVTGYVIFWRVRGGYYR